MKPIPWCERCGSRNHRSFDCQKSGTYVPTPEDLAEINGATEAVTPEPDRPDEPMFESSPRFPGCPPICTRANLPSFKDEAGARRWVNGFDGCKLRRVWRCEAGIGTSDEHWHEDHSPRSPGGESMDSEVPASVSRSISSSCTVLQDRYEARRRSAASRIGEDLPRGEAPPIVEKKVEKPAPKPVKKSVDAMGHLTHNKGRGDGELF